MDRKRHRINNGLVPRDLVHYRIKGGIKPGHDLAEVALMLAGIGTGGKFAGCRCIGKHIGVCYQGADSVDHLLHGSHDTGGVAGDKRYLAAQIANRNKIGYLTDLLGVGAQLAFHNPGNEKSEAHRQDDTGNKQDQHDSCSHLGKRSIAVGGQPGMFDLGINQLVDCFIKVVTCL